ncbi:MAG: T9SS type A sorting domain-containing protein [Chitinophagales bacterium]|nr:T9SS type A sorting domain-containing protein [Chitinophagaceae bacterium]MCB9064264.1 T9SS type A sorting domain-containing protein [Chitinophagales bacterium]
MNRILLILTICLLAITAKASHFSGGEIRYEFNGTNYDIYLSVYKICEQGATLPSSAAVQITSASQNHSSSLQMTFLGYDTVNINCSTQQSRCITPTSTIPGYITAKFKGTVSLPAAATDWVISYQNAARISGIVNLTTATSGTMYLYTNIDNSSAINSNPLLANSPSYYMTSGNNLVIPLQAIDPEGDNLTYTLIAPKAGPTVTAAYNSGYSATAPFGTSGTAAINTTNKTLTLKSNNVGYFVLALEVKEYRNSVLVGTYIREFTVSVLPTTSSTIMTLPAPSSTTGFTYYTCPGQSNSIVLSFTDPTSTDSVYLDVMPPSLSGWTFSVNTTPGVPTASSTITWTTPTTMNPATLPHFYITVRARDNGCPRAVSDYAVVVRTRQCLADSVWPGDANGDFTVNIYDPLAIAIANGQTGPTRTGASTSWVAQACTNWTNSFITNNTNMKHADCNGDGTVNSSDLAAVTANYNKSHTKGGRNKTTGYFDLYADFNNVTLSPGVSVKVPIKLGNASQTLGNVYGFATNISVFGVSLTAAPTISNTNSWIDNGASAVNFGYSKTNNTVEWAHARVDHTNVSGQGTIGELTFTVPNNAVIGEKIEIDFDYSVIINKDGALSHDVNTIKNSGVIKYPESVNDVTGNLHSVSLVPNPSGDNAVVNIILENASTISLDVTDVTGKKVWSIEKAYEKGAQRIQLPASDLSGGIYIIRIGTNTNNNASILKWIKH